MGRDRRDQPFHTLVTLGDSITAGGTATQPERCWAALLAAQIGDAQGAPLRLVNSGIGGDVVSSRSAGAAYSHAAGYPTALERVDGHVIRHRPDLVVVGYGVNDIAYGTPLHIFLDDLEAVATAAGHGTGALVVLLAAYFTNWTWPGVPDQLSHGRREVALAYNRGIAQLADRLDLLFSDVWSAMGEAPWTVDQDGVHPNDLGHRLIAARIFETLAHQCSVLARRAETDRGDFSQWRDESMLKSDFGPWDR